MSADYSTCCLRPSWAYLNRALEAEAERVCEEVTEELVARGIVVADNRTWALYQALQPKGLHEGPVPKGRGAS